MNATGCQSESDRRRPLIFSVDVECWAQSVLDPSLPLSEYCADNTRRLLDILAEDSNARGTFFVLGKFADKHPDVVRQIQDAGHEIGSHGWGHVQLYHLDSDALNQDLKRAVASVVDITGTPVRGYRAPAFSIGKKNLWALDVIQEHGFAYDSSIFPFNGPRYGIGDWPDETCRVLLGNGETLLEFPLTVWTFLRRRWPISGGGYARLLPRSVLAGLLSSEARRRKSTPVYYCHPYETDPGEFRRKSPQPPWAGRKLSLKIRLHQGLGRAGVVQKLRRLMKSFRFCSIAGAIESMDAGVLAGDGKEVGDGGAVSGGRASGGGRATTLPGSTLQVVRAADFAR